MVYIWFPNFRPSLMDEDRMIENLSAAFYFFSAFIAILFLKKHKIHKRILVLIAALGLLCFLEELSFGERIFGFSAPKIMGKKIDSTHDFLQLGHRVIKKIMYFHETYGYLLIGIGAIMVIIGVLKYWRKLNGTISKKFPRPTYILFMFFAALVFASLLIDLDIVYNNTLFMLEELLELNAAIALLFCCLSLNDSSFSNKPPIKSA